MALVYAELCYDVYAMCYITYMLGSRVSLGSAPGRSVITQQSQLALENFRKQ